MEKGAEDRAGAGGAEEASEWGKVEGWEQVKQVAEFLESCSWVTGSDRVSQLWDKGLKLGSVLPQQQTEDLERFVEFMWWWVAGVQLSYWDLRPGIIHTHKLKSIKSQKTFKADDD